MMSSFTITPTDTASTAQTFTVTAAVAPVKPPLAWFEMPEPNAPTPMTYADNGQVFGHAALWESCHRGFVNGTFSECVKPPPSETDYGQFHLGYIETAEGEQIAVGKITFGTEHADLREGMAAASRHYANSASVGAFVRAVNGKFGPWLSGSLRSDITEADVQTLRANPPSGDWRGFRRHLELIAALAVPVPGFAVPQFALAASGDVASLILPSWQFKIDEEVDMPTFTPSEMRQRKVLIEDSLTAAVMTTQARNNLPDSAFALPGRRYPINDIAHARNALARSSGKPEEAAVRRAVCRKYPDMGECAS